jgi:hypothetical protein
VNSMKLRIVLLAAATMPFGPAAMAQNAKADTPILSGTYIVRVTHVCQVTIAVTQSQSNGPVVNNVTVDNSGDANQNIGTVTFNPGTGKVTMAADSIDGSPVLFSFNGGPPLGTTLTDTAPSNPPPTFNYLNDSTSFTVGLESGQSVKYHAFYASLNGSTKRPQFMIFGGIEKPGCTTTGIAIQQ